MLAEKRKKYITAIKKEDGEYEGPEIRASSWEEAETAAQEQGVVLVGELGD
jgi:uncharacterized protein YdeI (BOF family)